MSKEYDKGILKRIHPKVIKSLEPIDWTNKVCENCGKPAEDRITEFGKDRTTHHFLCGECCVDLIMEGE